MNEKFDSKTLADVQPGGRVRLGDQARVTISDELLTRMAYAIPGAVETTDKAKEVAARVAEIYLSAQPSPGGQGDALPPLPPMGYEVRGTGMGPHDVYYTPAAYTAEQMQDYARAALAARQPVGEPVGEKLMRLLRERAALPESVELSYQRDGDGTGRAWWDRRHAELEAQGYSLDFETDSGAEWYTLRGIGDELRAALAEYDAAPPAQAVDLGQFREPIAAWSKHCAHSVKGYESYQDSDLPDWMAERRQQVRKCGELLALIDSHSGVSRD